MFTRNLRFKIRGTTPRIELAPGRGRKAFFVSKDTLRSLGREATSTASALLVLICLGMSLSSASMADSNLSPAWQQRTVANAFVRGRTIPRADHGYLFSFRRRIRQGDGENLFVRSLAGGEQQAITFSVEGASEIRAEDMAVNSGGQIYVAGSLMRPGEISPTNFVAEVGRSGEVAKFFDLGTYTPKRVCVENDGTFWTFGLGIGGNGEDSRGDRLLRQYSPDGHLLTSYLPSVKFPSLSRYGFGRAAVTLSCGDQSVGVYLARPARWIEVQFSDPVAYKWRIQPAPRGVITHAVLMGSHQVYATFSTRLTRLDGQPGVVSTTYKLSLPAEGEDSSASKEPLGTTGTSLSLTTAHSGNRAKGSWTQLPVQGTTNMFLLGRENESLIYTGPRVPGVDSAFYWVRPSRSISEQ